MNVMTYVIGLGILQAIVLAGLLVILPRGPRLPNAFMAGLVIAISGRLIHGWLTLSGQVDNATVWDLPMEALIFSWGPLLYLYVHAMTKQHLSLAHLLHFLPVIGYLLLLIPYYKLAGDEQRVVADYLWYERENPAVEAQFRQLSPPFYQALVEYRIIALAFIIHFCLYCFLVLQRIRQHNKMLGYLFSSHEKMNLRWLQVLTIACLVYIAALLVLNRIPQLLWGGEGFSQGVPYIFLVMIIYLIVIAALYQPSIIRGVIAVTEHTLEQTPEPLIEHEGATERQSPEPESSAKYSRSSISLEDAQRYKKHLMDVTKTEKLYLDSELTLPNLASAADITSHQVSQVLNGQLGLNFFTFINNFRINYAKELMADTANDHLAIVDLAFEVGFKSKSSFYSAFKKATDLTPAQFRKQSRE